MICDTTRKEISNWCAKCVITTRMAFAPLSFKTKGFFWNIGTPGILASLNDITALLRISKVNSPKSWSQFHGAWSNTRRQLLVWLREKIRNFSQWWHKNVKNYELLPCHTCKSSFVSDATWSSSYVRMLVLTLWHIVMKTKANDRCISRHPCPYQLEYVIMKVQYVNFLS